MGLSLLPIINTVIYALELAILASVVISWLRTFGTRVSPYNPIVHAIESVADLILRPIRRTFPVTGGGVDFSPMVAMLLLWVVQQFLLRAL
jgi:YggT family protein